MTQEEYLNSSVYYQEKGRLQGYNEIMDFFNSFPPHDPTFCAAKKMEREFLIEGKRSLTPVADKLNIHISPR